MARMLSVLASSPYTLGKPVYSFIIKHVSYMSVVKVRLVNLLIQTNFIFANVCLILSLYKIDVLRFPFICVFVYFSSIRFYYSTIYLLLHLPDGLALLSLWKDYLYFFLNLTKYNVLCDQYSFKFMHIIAHSFGPHFFLQFYIYTLDQDNFSSPWRAPFSISFSTFLLLTKSLFFFPLSLEMSSFHLPF